jgi:hypothetical protein
MLTSDEPSEIFRYYRSLILTTFRFAGRNILAVMVGITPVAALFSLLYALDPSSRAATRVSIYPATAITQPDGRMNNWHIDDASILIDLGKLRDSHVQIADRALDRDALTTKSAFCESSVSCLLFEMLLFETHSIDLPSGMHVDGPVVVRPVLLNSNPFWPYLNDLDFWFFITAMLGSITVAWRNRHRRTRGATNLRRTDFFLTLFAHSVPGILKLLGDRETNLLRSRLDNIRLDRPIFITGLARSGTTILLNLFARLPNIGTHRYRDFPFLFVPYAWNKFQDHMTKTDEPVERPHKDRINITKDSPDAFEEPIWMHFFPFVHQPDARHILTVSDDSSQFNAFYKEHLRKVLLIRGGKRYVSKGNYNIARLEYIAHLLPEALFVVPIRHPLTHVNSLVRQHRLFSRYSEEDRRVPEYMRAAGHYEFGPQRVPINLDEESGPRILEAWRKGQDHLGYAVMWRSVYTYVRTLTQADSLLAKRIKIVRYEDFCADPKAVLGRLLAFCELSDGINELLGALPEISAPESALDGMPEIQRDRVWRETAELAGSFGYRMEPAIRPSKVIDNGSRTPSVRRQVSNKGEK